MVLCVDEKTQIQALDRTAPILPLMPGVPERRTHDYRRNGTTDLFAALDPASGNVVSAMTPTHRSEDFRRFLRSLSTHSANTPWASALRHSRVTWGRGLCGSARRFRYRRRRRRR